MTVIEEMLERNKYYISLAEDFGFFKERIALDKNIASSTDWIIAWWIDELEKNGLSYGKYINEVLPNFKRWYLNGVKTTGVGRIYDVLLLAESLGLKIDSDSVACLISLNVFIKNTESSYDKMANFAEVTTVIKNLVRFSEAGIPIGHPLSLNYDLMLKLEQKGVILSRDTLVFLYTISSKTAADKLELYDLKEKLEEEYGYTTCNGAEVASLQNYYNTGYNWAKVTKLTAKKGKLNAKVSMQSSIFDVKKDLKANEIVTVTYLSINEEGKWIKKEVKGVFKTSYGSTICLTVYDEVNDCYEDLKIDFYNADVIEKIAVGGKTVYQNRFIKEMIAIRGIDAKIKKIESVDIFKMYTDKFGTVAGLGYLYNHALSFIQNVDSQRYPINNLFALIYEAIAGFAFKSPEELLKVVMCTYNKILNGDFEEVLKHNYGYDIKTFLGEETVNMVKQVCYYMVTYGLEEEENRDGIGLGRRKQK